MIESPFTRNEAKRDSQALPPPTYVRYLPQGEISEACLSLEPPRSGPRRFSAAQRAGMAFQRRAEKWAFSGSFSGKIVLGPWFYFVDASHSRHYCQPDILFDLGEVLVVCEVKLHWSVDAWWQLRKLYLPVLQKVYPEKVLIPLCVCKSFDPSIRAPEQIEIVADLFDCKPSVFNVILLP